MKKQASPAPTPRAAALSQSANRFSAGATSAWQNIANNSPRLAAGGPRKPAAVRVAAPLSPPPGTSRVALEPQRVAEQVAPAARPETIRQVGWREEDRAVGMSTKRKYSMFGIKFGPKVPVFETEKVKLPVYQETDREKRYYAVVEAKDTERVMQEGLIPAFNSAEVESIQSIKQFNTHKQVRFFSNELNAEAYAKSNIDGDYTILEFNTLEFQNFTIENTGFQNKIQTMGTTENIPSINIKSAKRITRQLA